MRGTKDRRLTRGTVARHVTPGVWLTSDTTSRHTPRTHVSGLRAHRWTGSQGQVCSCASRAFSLDPDRGRQYMYRHDIDMELEAIQVLGGGGGGLRGGGDICFSTKIPPLS